MATAADHDVGSLAAYMQGRLSLSDFEWPEPHRSSLSATISHDDLAIPEIDLQCLLLPGHGDDSDAENGTGLQKRELELAALRQAVSTCGFFQIYNHGIPVSVFETLRSYADRFFSRPLEQKLEVAKSLGGLFDKFKYHTGYACGTPLDSPLKWWNESLRIATCDKSYVAAVTKCLCIDEEDHKAFSDALESCSVGFMKLARQVSSILLQDLGLDAEVQLKELVDGKEESVGVKFNHYPACPQPEKTGGLPAHADVSLLTVLWQDAVGGLQVNKEGRWINVKPQRNSLVVNIGDIFQVWSNDRFKSGLHQVVLNTEMSRLSIACFYNPRYSCVLAPLPQLLKLASEPAKFKNILHSEYRQIVFQAISQGTWEGVEYLRCKNDI